MFSCHARAHPANRPDSAQKSLRRRRRTVPVIVGSLAGTLSATEPTRTTEIIHCRIDPRFPCPGFDLIGDFDLIREITTYSNHDGVAVRRIIHVDVTGTLTHAGTGETLAASGVRIFHFDLATRNAFSTGTNNVTKLPDGGVSNSGTGHLDFHPQGRLIDFHPQGRLIDVHGPPYGELDDLCAAPTT
jgi:hypothetical protein